MSVFHQPLAAGKQQADSPRRHEVDLRQIDDRRPLSRCRRFGEFVANFLGSSRVQAADKSDVCDVVVALENRYLHGLAPNLICGILPQNRTARSISCRSSTPSVLKKRSFDGTIDLSPIQNLSCVPAVSRVSSQMSR